MLFGIIVAGKGRPRLHRVRHQTVVADLHLRHMGRARKGRIHRSRIADLPVVDQVAFRLRMDLRSSRLKRRHRIDHGRQFLIIDNHRIGRIARLRRRVGHDNRDRLAHMAHDLMLKRPPAAHLHRRAVLGMDHPAADQVADAIAHKLVPGQNRINARHRQRRAGINSRHLRMRMR